MRVLTMDEILINDKKQLILKETCVDITARAYNEFILFNN